mmetsp:Transcript_21035/g.52164  ORF Transcript_21035/g.52164 Transcript_21035/m.52164 type:complete len:312 (-) Transcript_21035:636-1571(-)
MLPITAKGLAMILSATQDIMYPPDAATCSTAIVSLSPFSLRRASCPAAKPYPVTVPPPDWRITRASSPGWAFRITPVTSSRSSFSCEAWTSPGKSITYTDFGLSWVLRRAERGRSSIDMSKLPVPRTVISPKRALRRPIARLGPTAAKTCWMKSSSSSFSSVESFVASLTNSSFLGPNLLSFFFDFFSSEAEVSVLFADSSTSTSMTLRSSSFILSAFSPSLASSASIATAAKVLSVFCKAANLSFAFFKYSFSIRISLALTRGAKNSATVDPSTEGSAFKANPRARSKALERKSAAAFALLSVALVKEKS